MQEKQFQNKKLNREVIEKKNKRAKVLRGAVKTVATAASAAGIYAVKKVGPMALNAAKNIIKS